MKRYGNLWHKIVDIENIKQAHKQARKGKTFYTEVKMVDADLDFYANQIHEMLVSKEFTTSPYEVEERWDGKKTREIHKLPYYPDRIIQHALLSVIGELLTRSLIRDTFQSIKGRGTHDAAKRVKKVVRSPDCPKYALKVDIRKYYPSVNNDLMKLCVRKKIKCVDTLWLVDDIINSTQGLPIGNYTSQIFGNIYLSGLDWAMKQEVRPKAYFRYCDDIVVMSNNKTDLLAARKFIERLTRRLYLTIKPTWNIYNIHEQGVDFVGFVFRPTSTRLRKSITRSFKRSSRSTKNLSSLMAYKGWVRCCNAKKLWRKHTQHLISTYPKQLRKSL